MTALHRHAATGFWALTLASLVLAVALAVRAPTEVSMGTVQKVFYLHLPVAMHTFVAATAVFVAGAGYLATRDARWDALGHAAAEVTLLNGTVLLLTGSFWARIAWGQWWTWSPRLTFSLLLWLLYAALLVVRSMVPSPERRALVCAIYGVVAFLDVPLVYLSVKLLPDIHPESIGLTNELRVVLAAWFVPITLLTLGLIAARYGVLRAGATAEAARAAALGVTGAHP